jgi:hypothetical protein
MCWIFHQWGQWSERVASRCYADRWIQYRKCTKCGMEQARYIDY